MWVSDVQPIKIGHFIKKERENLLKLDGKNSLSLF